eukprot:2726023-Pleurochrysis_carterae.AAC.2
MVLRHSSIVLRHSSVVLRHSSIVLRHSSIVLRHSSMVLRHSSMDGGFLDAVESRGCCCWMEPLARGRGHEQERQLALRGAPTADVTKQAS